MADFYLYPKKVDKYGEFGTIWVLTLLVFCCRIKYNNNND